MHKDNKQLLFAIIICSFLLKLLCLILDSVVSRDGCIYIHLVERWYDTDSLQSVLSARDDYLPPLLLLYIMKSLMSFGLSAEHAGVLLNLVMGTFVPLLTYGISYEITQKKEIALGSAFLSAINPSMNRLSVEVLRDMVYLFFVGIIIWMLIAGIRRKKWGFWLGAGIVSGCSMQTRNETMEFIVIVLVSILLMGIFKHVSWKKAICYAGIYYLSFIGFFIVLTSLMQMQDVLIHNYQRYCSWKFKKVERQFYDGEKASLK